MRSYLSDLVMKGDKFPYNQCLGEPFNVIRPEFLKMIPPVSVPDSKYHPSLINLQVIRFYLYFSFLILLRCFFNNLNKCLLLINNFNKFLLIFPLFFKV